MGREDEIRIIAYRIWEEEGCCGHDFEHWLEAEVIWEEKQENEAASIDTKTKSKQTTKQAKKDRAAGKKQQIPTGGARGTLQFKIILTPFGLFPINPQAKSLELRASGYWKHAASL